MQGCEVLRGHPCIPAVRGGSPSSSKHWASEARVDRSQRTDPPAALCPALPPEPSLAVILIWDGEQRGIESCGSVGLVLTSGLWEMARI